LHKHLLRKKKRRLMPNQPLVLQHQPRLMPSLLIKKQSLLKAKPKKQSLLRSNPTKLILLSFDDEDIEIEFDDALITGYRRPKPDKPNDNDDDEELSDYVKLRLLIARLLAVEHAKKVWANS
jgi:hypothetical protein